MYTSSTMHITATAFMFKKAADLLLVIAYYNNWFCTYYNIPLTLQRVLSAASNFVSVSLYQQLLYQYHKTKNNYFKQRLFKQKSEPFLISHKMLHLNKKKNCVFSCLTSWRRCSSLVSTLCAPAAEYGGGGSSDGVMIAGCVVCAGRGGGMPAPCYKI